MVTGRDTGEDSSLNRAALSLYEGSRKGRLCFTSLFSPYYYSFAWWCFSPACSLPPHLLGIWNPPSLFAFLMAVFLEGWDSASPSDCAKVSFILSHLGGKALQWARPLHAQGDGVLDDSTSLLVRMMDFFGELVLQPHFLTLCSVCTRGGGVDFPSLSH